jgi:hypothetical protein
MSDLQKCLNCGGRWIIGKEVNYCQQCGLTCDKVFSLDKTPCGKPVYVTEMSTWAGNGYPDPLTGLFAGDTELKQIDKGDERYWVGRTSSGAFIRVFND